LEPEYPLLWALDFNVDPMCSVVAQVIDGTMYVLDEIVLSRSSTAEACEEFIHRYGRHKKELRVYGDASGNNRMTTGSTDYEVVNRCLREAGLKKVEVLVPRKNPSVRDRIACVNGSLRNAAGETVLYVDPKCKELIKDFEEVTYKDETSVIDKSKDPRRTHLSDALGYLMWQESRGQVKIGARKERIL
jgi:hypothetical protein